MFLAMNRFKIAHGFEEGFENIWRERESFLAKVPGFQAFTLLKGPSSEAYVLYASHSVWSSKTHFTKWTESSSFRRAHGQDSAPKGTYLDHPDLETFESVLEK